MPSILWLLGVASGVLSAACYVPYIYDIVRGNTRPERASWLIWSVLTAIGFFSNLAIGATNSLWLLAVQGIGVIIVFLLSLWRGYGGLLKRDIVTLVAAGATLVVWRLTNQPVVAVYLSVLIDAMGGYLTVVKAYEAPETELLVTWILSGLAGACALLSVGKLNVALLAYPGYIFLINSAVAVAILLGRKRIVREVQKR